MEKKVKKTLILGLFLYLIASGTAICSGPWVPKGPAKASNDAVAEFQALLAEELKKSGHSSLDDLDAAELKMKKESEEPIFLRQRVLRQNQYNEFQGDNSSAASSITPTPSTAFAAMPSTAAAANPQNYQMSHSQLNPYTLTNSSNTAALFQPSQNAAAPTTALVACANSQTTHSQQNQSTLSEDPNTPPSVSQQSAATAAESATALVAVSSQQISPQKIAPLTEAEQRRQIAYAILLAGTKYQEALQRAPDTPTKLAPADERCAKDPNEKLARAVRYYTTRPQAKEEIEQALKEGADPLHGWNGTFAEELHESMDTCRSLSMDLQRPEAFELFQKFFLAVPADKRKKYIIDGRMMQNFVLGIVEKKRQINQKENRELTCEEEHFWLNYIEFLIAWGGDVNCLADSKIKDLNSAENIKKLSGARGWSQVNFEEMLEYLKDRRNYLLHIAAKFGLLETVKMLVHYGANIFKYNTQGKTPLMLAKERRHKEVAKFLSHKTIDDDYLKKIKNQNDAVVFIKETADVWTLPAPVLDDELGLCMWNQRHSGELASPVNPSTDVILDRIGIDEEVMEAPAAEQMYSPFEQLYFSAHVEPNVVDLSKLNIYYEKLRYACTGDGGWSTRFIKATLCQYPGFTEADTFREIIENVNKFAFNGFREMEELFGKVIEKNDPQTIQILSDMFTDVAAYRKYKNQSDTTFTEEKPLMYYIFSCSYMLDPRVFQGIRKFVAWKPEMTQMFIEIMQKRILDMVEMAQSPVNLPIVYDMARNVKYLINFFIVWGNLSAKDIMSILRQKVISGEMLRNNPKITGNIGKDTQIINAAQPYIYKMRNDPYLISNIYGLRIENSIAIYVLAKQFHPHILGFIMQYLKCPDTNAKNTDDADGYDVTVDTILDDELNYARDIELRCAIEQSKEKAENGLFARIKKRVSTLTTRENEKQKDSPPEKTARNIWLEKIQTVLRKYNSIGSREFDNALQPLLKLVNQHLTSKELKEFNTIVADIIKEDTSAIAAAQPSSFAKAPADTALANPKLASDSYWNACGKLYIFIQGLLK